MFTCFRDLRNGYDISSTTTAADQAGSGVVGLWLLGRKWKIECGWFGWICGGVGWVSRTSSGVRVGLGDWLARSTSGLWRSITFFFNSFLFSFFPIFLFSLFLLFLWVSFFLFRVSFFSEFPFLGRRWDETSILILKKFCFLLNGILRKNLSVAYESEIEMKRQTSIGYGWCSGFWIWPICQSAVKKKEQQEQLRCNDWA